LKAARRKPRFSQVSTSREPSDLAVQLFLTGRSSSGSAWERRCRCCPSSACWLRGGCCHADAIVRRRISTVSARRQFCDRAPTREVLFTVLPREDRYKPRALSTPCLSLGDQLGAWSFALLSTFFGLGLTQVSIVATVISGFGCQ